MFYCTALEFGQLKMRRRDRCLGTKMEISDEKSRKEKQTNENRRKIHAADIKLSNKIFKICTLGALRAMEVSFSGQRNDFGA